MIVLSEDSPRLMPSPSARSLKSVTEAARIVGCRVHYIPQEEVGVTAAEALPYVPWQETVTTGMWLGYIPSSTWYATIYEAALQQRIRLLNTPEEHLNAQEFDRTYLRLRELTPTSVIVSDSGGCAQTVQELGLPVFVKGAIQSRKGIGWKACVANTLGELEHLYTQLLALDNRWPDRGR